MSSAYAGKSDEQIIQEQASDLASKSNWQTSDKFNPRNTTLSDESALNESGVSDKFPSLDGQPQVQVGRGGQTGGGTNPQTLSADEGGLGADGSSSAGFEGLGGPEDKAKVAYQNNPGGTNLYPDDERSRVVRGEAIPSVDKPGDGQPLLTDQRRVPDEEMQRKAKESLTA